MKWTEWVFSGIGAAVIGWIGKLVYDMMKKPTHVHVHLTDIDPSSVSTEKRVPASKPVIEALQPRITHVEQMTEHITRPTRYGLMESREGPFAVVVPFRLKKPSSDGDAVRLVARLEFRSDDGKGGSLGKIALPVIHHVHNGMWLGEFFNRITMTLIDTKELILVVQEPVANEIGAIQDNRKSTGSFNAPSGQGLPDVVIVSVTLVDTELGELCRFLYKIENNPLRVFRFPSLLD